MRITVEVTKSDIENAKRYHHLYADMSLNCPIAFALQRHLPLAGRVVVSYNTVYIGPLPFKATAEYKGIIERFAVPLSDHWVPTTFDIEAL